MTRDTYTDRERALRAEIEKQARDLNLKYVTELEVNCEFRAIGFVHAVAYAAFDFGDGPKGFYALGQGQSHDVDVAAAQFVGMARHWKAKHYPPPPPSDITNWAAP